MSKEDSLETTTNMPDPPPSTFKGSDTYSVDQKGRISIPAKMRRQNPEARDFVISRGIEQCLYVYPMEAWQRLETSIGTLQQADDQERFFLRMLMQWSEQVAMDQQSRLLISGALLDFASIKSEVYIIGVLDHIELWNPIQFDKYMLSMKKSYETVAMEVLGNQQAA